MSRSFNAKSLNKIDSKVECELPTVRCYNIFTAKTRKQIGKGTDNDMAAAFTLIMKLSNGKTL